MEFLKPVLGDALYEQVQRKLEGQELICAAEGLLQKAMKCLQARQA